MTLQSQAIFDKSDLVRLRTEECENHSHTLKPKNSEVIFINGCRNFGYMSFKITNLLLNTTNPSFLM
jgi:hypothetical protein